MPSFDAPEPLSYLNVPEEEREKRCDLGSDHCLIDNEFFFVRGCLEVPVIGEDAPFTWGVWVSLSKASFSEWVKCYDSDQRSHVGPFFGWLNTFPSPYQFTQSLKTNVHIRDNGIRPFIELEPTDHPLAVEQRNGISVERVGELYALVMPPVPE